MKRQVVHEPITQMKEVGTRHQAREQMQALGARLVEAIGEPVKKKKKTKHTELARHKGKKQKTVHAVPVERAVPVSHYLQAADLSPPQLAQVLKRAAETRPHIQKAIVPPRVSTLHLASVQQRPPRSLTRDPSDLPKNRGQRQSLSRSQSRTIKDKPVIHDRRVPSRSRTPSQARQDQQKPLRSHSTARETGTVNVLGTSVSRRGTQRNLFRDESGHRIGRHHSSADRMSVQRNVRSGLSAEDKALYERMKQRDSRSAETFRKKLDGLNEQARKRELLKPKNFAINDRLAGDEWLDSQRRIQERMRHVPEMLAKQKKNEELRKKRWESQEHVRLSEFKQKEIQQRIEQEKMKANELTKRQTALTNRASQVTKKDLGYNFKTEFVSARLPQNKKKEVSHIRRTINTLDKQVKNSEQKLKKAIQDQKTWTHKASFFKSENEKRMSESRERYPMERPLPPKIPLHKTATAYTPVTHESKRERNGKWYKEQNERRMQASRMRSQSREVAPVTSADIHAARISDANYRKAQHEAEKQRKQMQEQRRTRQISEKANRLFRQAEHHRIQSEKSRDQMLHQSREAARERKFQEMKHRQLSQGPPLDRDKLGLTDSKTHDENMRLNRALMKKYTLSMQELSRIFSKTDLIHQRERIKQELAGVMAYDPQTLMSIDPEPRTPQRSKAKIITQTVTKKPQNIAPPRRKVVVTPPQIKVPQKSGTVTQVRRPKSPVTPVVQKPPIAKHMKELNAAAQKLVKQGKPKLREELLARGIGIDDEWTAFEMAKQLEKAGAKKTTYEDLDMTAKRLTDKSFADLSEMYDEKYNKKFPISWNKYDLARAVSKIEQEKKPQIQKQPARIIQKETSRQRHDKRRQEALQKRRDIRHQQNLKESDERRAKVKEKEELLEKQKLEKQNARARLLEKQKLDRQQRRKQQAADLKKQQEEIAATKRRQKEAQDVAKKLRLEKARLQKEAKRLKQEKADAETRREKADEIRRLERDAKQKQKEAATLKKTVESQRRKKENEARRHKELERRKRIAEKKENARLQREERQKVKDARIEALRVAKQHERFKKEQMKERQREQRELRDKERQQAQAERIQQEKKEKQELRAKLQKQEEQRQQLSREREVTRQKSEAIQRRIQHGKAQARIRMSQGDTRRRAAHDSRIKQFQAQQRKLADFAKLKQQEKAAAQKKKQHLQDIRERSAEMQERITKEKTLQGQRAADKKRQQRLQKVLERSHAYQDEKEIEDLASRLQSTVRVKPKVQRVSKIHVPTSTQMQRKLYIDTGPQMHRVLKLQNRQQHVRKNPKRITLDQPTISFTQRIEQIQPTYEEHLQKREKKKSTLQRLQEQQDIKKKTRRRK